MERESTSPPVCQETPPLHLCCCHADDNFFEKVPVPPIPSLSLWKSPLQLLSPLSPNLSQRPRSAKELQNILRDSDEEVLAKIGYASSHLLPGQSSTSFASPSLLDDDYNHPKEGYDPDNDRLSDDNQHIQHRSC
ncbi:Hypothetical predicted protein [Cloeon dipterum]|uniref:Uncharacterized protein n=1 Tax=Cloeon dipterum TaxID=197152 RepID=A0A8S1E8I1_9INSE|nr:Hypothetical predicted protein [Cloeon dipterum]